MSHPPVAWKAKLDKYYFEISTYTFIDKIAIVIHESTIGSLMAGLGQLIFTAAIQQ
jgi:hypothetical protein